MNSGCRRMLAISADSATCIDEAVGLFPSGRRRESHSVWNSGSEAQRWKFSSAMGRTTKRRPFSETGVPEAGKAGFRAEVSGFAAGFGAGCADCSRFMPKRLLPSEDDLSPPGCLSSCWAARPVVMSWTTASAVDWANVAIGEFMASAAWGEAKSRGNSHAGWCGVSSHRIGSSPSGGFTKPDAATCHAFFLWTRRMAGHSPSPGENSSTPVMSDTDFAPPEGNLISIVLSFVSCNFTTRHILANCVPPALAERKIL